MNEKKGIVLASDKMDNIQLDNTILPGYVCIGSVAGCDPEVLFAVDDGFVDEDGTFYGDDVVVIKDLGKCHFAVIE